MKNYLFPNRFKTISGWIFYLSLIIGSYLWFTDQFDDLLVVPVPDLFGTDDFLRPNGIWIHNGILDELLTIIIIVAGIIHSFSREKVEDELISKLRLDSLIWSLYVNYAIMILATLLIFGLSYFHILVFNLFTIILFFNLRLRYSLHKHYAS
ncbi:hypothetical protein SAMN06265375_10169 [Muriicola jejuensis]|uniref:Uncharacterized protein n=1 Tax=Muriicola jejuensis TaxID=504488 RepID=A0A6P0UF70_9FLAO|nr:hypothetical protein [Muriicola jejuensis]NER10388.1 hypothetical protein [Muriicola jejuensis]SMP00974.1 hypothetical protein SAMN06265375_10169 [Muriicola jejuensis]